jgi:hypothetical protein
MTWRVAAVGAAMLFAAVPVAAQLTARVQVTGPQSNPITDGVGTFSVAATNFLAEDLPLRLELQVSTSPDFSGQLYADTIVNGPSAVITIPRLLPPTGVLYWRAFALTARAGSIPSAVTGPATAPTHLRLIAPNNPAGQSLNTRRPTFVWQSSRIPASVGSWDYELRVEESETGRVRAIANTTDTTVDLAADLESNKSYRWRVLARLRATHDSVNVASFASFVVLSGNAPLATLLFNPFPSPFPSGNVTKLCIWFDLSAAATVTLDILDIRGLPVRTIVPGQGMGAALDAGQYGRPSPGATSGCDSRFEWDGTDAGHRFVPPGIYLVRLKVGGRAAFYKKVDFERR